MTTKTDAKVLVIDIETAPIQAVVWQLWDANIGINQIQEDWTILSYCAKWLEKDELIYSSSGGKGSANVRHDGALLHEIWQLLDKADIIIAQNGNKFDLKKINARLLMAGYGPYSPIRVIDTLEVAKRHFGFTSNKLAWLSDKLTDTPKSDHRKFPGFDLWVECLKDNPEAWEEMEKYNKIDVIATEKVYLAQRPWITNHPNLAAYSDGEDKEGCPKCGSDKLHSRGKAVSQSGSYIRFQCQECGGWSRSKKMVESQSDKPKKVLLNN